MQSILTMLYQAIDEQAVCGTAVGLFVLPQLFQTKCLPVQGLATFFTH